MKQNKRWISLLCLLILVAAAVTGGYFAGKTAEAKRFQAEKDFSILLNRSDLEVLDKIEGPIYVTGHKSPDADTVGSSIAYAKLLQTLGYDAVPAVLGDINDETALILATAGVETPELLESAAGLNMVLVDHSEYAQSADGLTDANVIGIIDHHGVGSVTTGTPMMYDARPIGATATITWLRFRNYGVEPDRQTAIVMLGAVLSDTMNLQTDTTTFADREAVRVLGNIGGISDTDTLYQQMFKASLSYDGKTDAEIFLSDYREYEIGGKNLSVGVVDAYEHETAKDLAQRMKAVMPSLKTKTGMDMTFCMVSILHDDMNSSYLVPAAEAEEEVLHAAFGESTVYDGVSFIAEPGMSRKSGFIPAITAVLESYPKE